MVAYTALTCSIRNSVGCIIIMIRYYHLTIPYVFMNIKIREGDPFKAAGRTTSFPLSEWVVRVGNSTASYM